MLPTASSARQVSPYLTAFVKKRIDELAFYDKSINFCCMFALSIPGVPTIDAQLMDNASVRFRYDDSLMFHGPNPK